MAQVLAMATEYFRYSAEAIRLGIIDEKARLLKTELPEDMREDAGTDFGGWLAMPSNHRSSGSAGERQCNAPRAASTDRGLR
jgi:hypothetical protein